jgi:hypothetical protein
LPLPPVVPARYAPGGREPGPSDGGPPPRWPWVLVSVVAALVLVAGVVVALVLSGGSDVSAAGAAPAGESAQPLLFGAGKRPVTLDSIPDTVRAEPPLAADRALTGGPDGAVATTALQFLQAVRVRDWPAAYGLCAGGVRSAAADRARTLNTSPATVVGAAFYGDELHGQAIAGGRLVAVESYPAQSLVTVRLQLADAAVATVTLWVGRGLTVEDWT